MSKSELRYYSSGTHLDKTLCHIHASRQTGDGKPDIILMTSDGLNERPEKNTVDGKTGRYCHFKAKYFNFIPPAKLEVTTEYKTRPKRGSPLTIHLGN